MIKTKVIVISGAPCSGKDLFVSLCKTYCPDRVLNFSSVDFIKWSLAKSFDIDVNNKTPKLRKLISDVKAALTEYNDLPFKMCVDAIDTLQDDQIIFLHVREKSEIDKIKEVYPDTLVVKVELINNDIGYGNLSDDRVNNIDYNVIIYNDGEISELNKTAKWFVEKYINE